MIRLVGMCFLMVKGAAPALACYHKPGDRAETLMFSDDGKIIWRHGKKVRVFEDGSGGTGVDYRIAFDAKGRGLRYESVGKKLKFGGVIYVPGC